VQSAALEQEMAFREIPAAYVCSVCHEPGAPAADAGVDDVANTGVTMATAIARTVPVTRRRRPNMTTSPPTRLAEGKHTAVLRDMPENNAVCRRSVGIRSTN
jgi:hypothetical protein